MFGRCCGEVFGRCCVRGVKCSGGAVFGGCCVREVLCWSVSMSRQDGYRME